MTHDYKKVLDDAVAIINRFDGLNLEKFVGKTDGENFCIAIANWASANIEQIKSALQLAQEAEQVHEKLADERMENIKQFALIEQLRKDNERLVRENEVYAERHKAWESCVYAVGLPMMKSVRDTEYGDAVPPVPVVNKITDLLDECFQLRKERDELARAYRYADAVATEIGHIVDASPQTKIWRELAKKVNENGNA